MRICVVGAGAAGLAALRVLSEEIENYPIDWECCCFERTSTLGGVWNYDRDTSKKFVSPMYEELRTNLPKEVMGYPDCPFRNDLQCSFIHHTEVLNYIKYYAKKYDLERFITFNSNIEHVEPIVCDGVSKWKVSVTKPNTEENMDEFFDVVVVANGHFERPLVPDIKGVHNFKGHILHSKLYRTAEEFRNKTIFVLGARSSGMDIAVQLSNVAKKVYLSHNRDRLYCKRLLELAEVTYGIREIDSDGFICTVDGSKYEADVLIFCTGYQISLDFLSELCQIRYDNAYIRPLYKNMISPYFPKSLFFIGFGYEIAPFTFFYMQSKVVRSILHNCDIGIPTSTDELLESVASEKIKMDEDGVPMRHRHFFNNKQWSYYKWCESTALEVMTATVPRHLKHMFNIVKKWRFENTDVYREVHMEVSEENELGFVIKNGPENNFYSADFEACLKNLSKSSFEQDYY